MDTMHPAIRHGLTTWDRRVLPRDEFEQRRAAVAALAAAAGCLAVVGFDEATRPGLAAWTTNYRGGTSTVIMHPASDRTVLLAGLGGARDHPFIRSVSCVEDVRWYPSPGAGVLEVLGEAGLRDGPIGLVGADRCLGGPALERLHEALGGFEQIGLEQEWSSLRRRKRRRELVVMALGRRILEASAACLRDQLRRGESLERACLAATRLARLRGCTDVRVLRGAPDATLRPWPSSGAGGDSWAEGWASVYLTADYLGYWSAVAHTVARDGFVTPLLAEEALRAALSAASAGVRVELVAAAGTSGPPGTAGGQDAVPVRGGGTVVEAAGIGIDATEAPLSGTGEGSVLRCGDVLSVVARATAPGFLGLAAADVVVVKDTVLPIEQVVGRDRS